MILIFKVRKHLPEFDTSDLNTDILSPVEEMHYLKTGHGRFEHNHCHWQRSARQLDRPDFLDSGTGAEMLSTVCMLEGLCTGLAPVVLDQIMCNRFKEEVMPDGTHMNSQSKGPRVCIKVCERRRP